MGEGEAVDRQHDGALPRFNVVWLHDVCGLTVLNCSIPIELCHSITRFKFNLNFNLKFTHIFWMGVI